ncbi:cytochrome c nitrite reductase small subunit [Campylobacter troglodytis]|uniref:cytochrome c nitrite reductase small subunit n=1 Tax=Campylobacter troglodytis TaxID=654363 RepID=UPI001158221A|nr:cytochrome c nitrite reductase small subunit [Campylobacter troglodytis]TQR60877.1 cytochrome c nitrite reductase small subunit [Campylobacter troglodytis]
MKELKNSLFTVFIVLLFVFFALAFYTFYNAKGISYLSDSSSACNNCHIMNEVYNDYIKSPHSKQINSQPIATCNDCHVPHNFINKWLAKAQSGLGHGYAFSFKLNELPVNLSANEKTKRWVQDNCVRCHSEVAAHTVSASLNPHKDQALKCVSCHTGVGHKRGF